MNQQLKGWRLINKAVCPFKHIFIQLNYWNPGEELQGCAFLETWKPFTGTYWDVWNCLLWHTQAITSPLHVSKPLWETAQQAGASRPAAPDVLGKDALQSNLCPPQAGARSELPQRNLQEPENFCKLCQLAQGRRATLLAKNHLNAAAHWMLPLLWGWHEEEKKVYFILVNTAHTDISM